MVAFLFGWASLVLIQGGGIAAVAITFSSTRCAFPARPGRIRGRWRFCARGPGRGEFVGVKTGSRLLNFLVLLKIGALAVLIVGGLWRRQRVSGRARRGGPASPRRAPRVRCRPRSDSLFVRRLAERQLRRRRDAQPAAHAAPRSILGTLIVVVVYVAVNLVYLRTLGRDGLASTTTPASKAVA